MICITPLPLKTRRGELSKACGKAGKTSPFYRVAITTRRRSDLPHTGNARSSWGGKPDTL